MCSSGIVLLVGENYEIQILVSVNKILLQYNHIRSFIYYLWLLLNNSQLVSTETIGLTNSKLLLLLLLKFVLLQKKFTDVFSKVSRKK